MCIRDRDEAQLLIEQAADKVTVAVQHEIFGLGRRIREVIFLGVQAFMYLSLIHI